MKTFALLFALFAGFQFSQAAVLTVNNSNPSPGQFTTLAAAYAASSANDTIYLHGSVTPYESISINTHPIVIFGAGFNPNTASGFRSIISGSSFSISVLAIGSKFYGLTFSGSMNGQSVSQEAGLVHNILFDRCSFHSSFVIAGNDWQITKCVFGRLSDLGGSGNISFTANVLNTFFLNNVFILSSTNVLSGTQSTNTTYANNLFIRNFSSVSNLHLGSTPGTVTIGASFHSNIFIGLNPAGNCTNCSFEFNLSFIPSYMTSGTLPDLNLLANSSGNIIANPLFNAFPTTSVTANFDMVSSPQLFDPVLQPGSPALTAGPTNNEIGPFGGSIPFTKTGEPDLPIVRTFTLQNIIVPAGTNLEVQFTATPNN
jgi:hypothetical protein